MPWWYDVEDPNGWDVPPWVEDPAADRLFPRKLKPVPLPAEERYSGVHHPSDQEDTTVQLTVNDIQDGEAVKAVTESGVVVLDCKAVKVIRMLQAHGDPTYARLNNNDPDWHPLGGRFAGPSVNLNHPATKTDSGWLVRL